MPRQKRNTVIDIVIAVILTLCVMAPVVWITAIKPAVNYNKARRLMDSGKYEDAMSAFESMKSYKDIAEQIELCRTAISDEKYSTAAELYKSGKYDEALAILKVLDGYKNSDKLTEKCYIGKLGERLYYSIKDLRPGDTFEFGTYEQDNVKDNGKEAIEWTVLERDGMSFMLISKYALDCRKYNSSFTDVTWETCSLRAWLNEDFLNEAFSADELKYIAVTEANADMNKMSDESKYHEQTYKVDAGKATNDKVFILSGKEAESLKYFANASLHPGQCSCTEYCKAQGADEHCTWWLRTPGISQRKAAVYSDGDVIWYGMGVLEPNIAVRPSIRINMA